MIRGIPQTIALLGTALLIVGAGWPLARAQAPESGGAPAVYTYVALWGVPRAQSAQVEKYYKDVEPTLKKLMADGTLTGWGTARNWVHDDTGMTHASWVSATSFANIYRAGAVIHEALPLPAAFANAKHVDQLIRSTIYGGKPGASGSGMLWVADYQVRPGQMDDFTKLFESDIKPLFDQQVAAGTVLSYWLNVSAIHTGPPGGASIVYLMPDAAAIDKFQAALAAYGADHPDTGPALEAVMDLAAHRDYVFEVLSFSQK
jgi:hypothetical protein